MSFKHWIQAARLRTLPLSVSGIIVGCGLAGFARKTNSPVNDAFNVDGILYILNAMSYKIDYTIFILAILTTIGFQILSNFANDYGDGIKGTDANRQGEKRMVASGAITPKQMKTGIIMTGILTMICAILLIYISFGKENFLYSVLFFFLGIASIVAAIKYTVGNNAYGYFGFGDVFVFLFFGWLSVLGSYFLYRHSLNWDLFLPASSIGLLSTAVLNLNNMRDRIQDQKAGKNTLVVKLGSQNAKKYHYTLISLAIFFAILYVVLNYYSPLQFLFLIVLIPLISNIIVVGKNIIHKDLDGELKKVALSTFLFAILFALFN